MINLCDAGADNLMIAICKQAATDYYTATFNLDMLDTLSFKSSRKKTHFRKKNEKNLNEVKKFLNSDWYQELLSCTNKKETMDILDKTYFDSEFNNRVDILANDKSNYLNKKKVVKKLKIEQSNLNEEIRKKQKRSERIDLLINAIKEV